VKSVPKVSVILTSFNHDRFVGEAIESVLAQTFQDFELIIADDASTDRSREVISSYKDPRIRLFQSEKNERGLINKVLKSGLVLGQYVAIHHSDDVWEGDKLARQVEILDSNPQVAAVFTTASIIDANGRMFEEHENLDDSTRFYIRIFNQENRNRDEWLRRFFFQENCLCHPSAMIRKSCYDSVGCYNVYYRQLPDFDFWIRICLQHEIFILQDKLVRFRILDKNQNTSSQTEEALARHSFEILQIFNHFAKINDTNRMLSIFPELRPYQEQGDIVPAYVLARMAMESNTKVRKLFGLLLLGEKMKDEIFRDACLKKHGFHLSDFHQLIGSKNIL
jgi:glycosyltransferase involved in cell wall biosynthesis